jgi:organic hydroperoxide reductase OsmC/OhrA
LPHVYETTAAATPAGPVTLRTPGVPDLATALPAEFGGTGDQWSPETLFAAAIADCFVLTFRGVAAANKVPWLSVACDVKPRSNGSIE